MRIHNPYLTAFRKAASDPEANAFFESIRRIYEASSERPDDLGDLHSHMIEWMVRDRLIKTYAYAVPTTKAIRLIAAHSPILEIGAGTGYWAKLLRDAGADVIAVDNGAETPARLWSEVAAGDENIASDHPDRTLLLIWPPHGLPMASRALDLHVRAGGTRVIYVGERKGGCTADTDFFNRVYREYTVVKSLAIPQWHGLSDFLAVLERKDK